MTCAELIEALKKQPPDRMVFCRVGYASDLAEPQPRVGHALNCRQPPYTPEWIRAGQPRGAIKALFLC